MRFRADRGEAVTGEIDRIAERIMPHHFFGIDLRGIFLFRQRRLAGGNRLCICAIFVIGHGLSSEIDEFVARANPFIPIEINMILHIGGIRAAF